jgi:PAS domain S-box-containing protein
LPQPLVEIECLGQTLTPVVTNLEAGKFLWQMLAEVRATLLPGLENLSPSPLSFSADEAQQSTNENGSEHQQVEEALLLSEERFRQVIDSISDHIYVTEITAEGHFVNLYLSPHVATLTHYSWQKFIDDWSFWPALIHPDDQAAAAAQATQLAKGQNSSIEYRLKQASGNFIWVRDSGQARKDAQGKITIYGLVSDITLRKQAEEALRQSEERFTLAVQGSNDGIWDWNISNNWLYWSPRLIELLGYSVDELDDSFDKFESRLHPDDKERVNAALAAHLKHEMPYDVEQRLRTKSDDYRWFRIRGQAVWDENGQPLRMVGSASDITEQKRVEIERERLIFEVEQRATREQAIREITDKLRTASSLKHLVEIATKELQQRLSATHAKLELGLEIEKDHI